MISYNQYFGKIRSKVKVTVNGNKFLATVIQKTYNKSI